MGGGGGGVWIEPSATLRRTNSDSWFNSVFKSEKENQKAALVDALCRKVRLA